MESIVLNNSVDFFRREANKISLNAFTEFREKIFLWLKRLFKPATSCVGDQNVTTEPQDTTNRKDCIDPNACLCNLLDSLNSPNFHSIYEKLHFVTIVTMNQWAYLFLLPREVKFPLHYVPLTKIAWCALVREISDNDMFKIYRSIAQKQGHSKPLKNLFVLIIYIRMWDIDHESLKSHSDEPLIKYV